jgi:hypothetical protein
VQLQYNELCAQLIMYEDTWMKSISSGSSNNQPAEAALTVAQRRNNNNWRGNTQSQQYQYRGRRDQVQRKPLVCYRCDREGIKHMSVQIEYGHMRIE